jgi:hypothetical protein
VHYSIIHNRIKLNYERKQKKIKLFLNFPLSLFLIALAAKTEEKNTAKRREKFLLKHHSIPSLAFSIDLHSVTSKLTSSAAEESLVELNQLVFISFPSLSLRTIC